MRARRRLGRRFNAPAGSSRPTEPTFDPKLLVSHNGQLRGRAPVSPRRSTTLLPVRGALPPGSTFKTNAPNRCRQRRCRQAAPVHPRAAAAHRRRCRTSANGAAARSKRLLESCNTTFAGRVRPERVTCIGVQRFGVLPIRRLRPQSVDRDEHWPRRGRSRSSKPRAAPSGRARSRSRHWRWRWWPSRSTGA